MSDSTDQPQSGQETVRGTQAQLERETGKTNTPVTRFPEDEARLKSVRTDIQSPLVDTAATNAVPGSGPAPNDLITQKVIEILTSLATDPFAMIKLSVQDAQRTALENNLRSGSQTPSPSAENVPNSPGNSETPITNSIISATTSPTPPSPGDSALGLVIPQPRLPTDLGKVSDLSQPSFAGSESGVVIPSDSFSGAADLHTQALQVSGARMQAVLEQNTQLTVSLFDQVMNLLDAQNGALGEMSRKISELGGQIKSLKNP